MTATAPNSANEALATRRYSSTPVPTICGSRERNIGRATHQARTRTAETSVLLMSVRSVSSAWPLVPKRMTWAAATPVTIAAVSVRRRPLQYLSTQPLPVERMGSSCVRPVCG